MIENKSKPISIVFTINDKYTLPVIVCIISLLDSANSDTQYQIIIISDDITLLNRKKILRNCSRYQSCESVKFVNYDSKLIDSLWNKTVSKYHYSKEIIARLMLPNLLPDLELIILSDADVIYCKDISDSLTHIDKSKIWHIAGVKFINKVRSFYDYSYKEKFSLQDIELLKNNCVSAGFCIVNLKQMRSDDMVNKYLEYYNKNAELLVQPEQDVLCMCSYPYIQYLPSKYMVCTYIFTLNSEEIHSDLNFTSQDIIEAINEPVQIHYVSAPKPWESHKVIHWKKWYVNLKKTTVFKEYLYLKAQKIIDSANELTFKKLKKIVRNFIYG